MKSQEDVIETLGIKNKTSKECIKYLFVGGTCTILDFCILFIGAELLDLNYLLVSIFSFIWGVVLNYFLCTYWVFKIHIIVKAPLEFGFYVLISLVGLSINTGVMYFSTDILGLYVMTSKLVSASSTFFWNFFARKYLLHYRREKNK